MQDAIWVLTEEYNDYDQHGQYFVAAWKDKPSITQLMKVEGVSESDAKHILQGGGRRGDEYQWYSLLEYAPESGGVKRF
jgi:hypothetical protein